MYTLYYAKFKLKKKRNNVDNRKVNSFEIFAFLLHCYVNLIYFKLDNIYAF